MKSGDLGSNPQYVLTKCTFLEKLIFLVLIFPSSKWRNSTHRFIWKINETTHAKHLKWSLNHRQTLIIVIILINTLSDDLVSYLNSGILLIRHYRLTRFHCLCVFTPSLPSSFQSHLYIYFQILSKCPALSQAQDATARECGAPPFWS